MDPLHIKRPIKLTLKQWTVRILLAFLRVLIVLKRHVGPRLLSALGPIRSLLRWVMRFVGVPLYRLLFFVRRSSSRVLMPAKNKALYLVSNRLAIHGAIAVIALTVSVLNFSGGEVRAETFGKNSILYGLVAEDESHVLETVSAKERSDAPIVVAYFDEPGTDLNTHIDYDYLGDLATPETGTSDTTPTPSRSDTPSRTDIITYVVEDGDTQIGIARKFGLKLTTLQWANDLNGRSTIRPGQELTILPVDGVQHKVKSGENLSKIARTYGADSKEIVKQNKLANADDLRVGETLLVPDGSPPTPAPRRIASPREIFTPTPKPTTPSAPRGSSTGSGSWVWPTDWRVITQYYGWRHTGIDVDGDYGTNSYASAGGTVIYSGWRRGYGLTVEVDHGSGLVTRYAHHAKNYVNVGDQVTAGQIIAQTGTTGRSTGTHLHFEVIKNGKFQNPLDWVR